MSIAGSETVGSRPRRPGELTPTNRDLLERVRNPDDHDSWQEFFDLYRKLIHRAAIKAGLSEAEAEEVVQQTMIGAARRMENFRYQPERCSFKGWLMHLTRGHILNCIKRRRTQAKWFEPMVEAGSVEEIPDSQAEAVFEAMWTEEWHDYLRSAAESRVRRNTDPAHYEIYHLRFVQNMPIKEVSERLCVFPLSVRVVSHRVAQKVRREVERDEQKLL